MKTVHVSRHGADVVSEATLPRLGCSIASTGCCNFEFRIMANSMNDLRVVLFSKHEFVYDPGNHRGTHLTFHICKIAESVIVFLIVPQLIHNGSFGRNDFAYILERGARDVLAELLRTL